MPDAVAENVEGSGARESLTGFWSYVHGDNSATFNKILNLHADLCALYTVETGEKLNIFVDRQAIGWGEQWQDVIDRGINQTVFMIPIITANYFVSDACRSELLSFYSLCKARGLTDLILPIIFSGKDRIDKESSDEISRIVADSQAEDFSDVWPRERGGELWMTTIRSLVLKLVAAERRVEERLELALAQEVDDSARSGGGGIDDAPPSEEIEQEDLDSPGLIDLAEDLRTHMEEASAALNCAVQGFTRVSNLLAEHGEKVGKASTPSAWKTSLFTMAREVAEPAAEFERDASKALDKIVAADSTFRGVIQAIGGMQSDLGRAVELSFAAELQQAPDVGETLDQLSALAIQIADVEKLSAVLKKALRPARLGLRLTRDAGRIYQDWRNISSPKAS